MQPVERSTTVRGPAALTISFMISADSQPWHVRWPDVKYSSMVTFLMPRKASRTCVALSNVVSGIRCLLLFPHAEPAGLRVGLAGVRGIVTKVRRLIDILERHLAAAETADEAEQRRPLGGVVERRADLVGDHAGGEWRAHRVVAIDDADRLGPGQHGHDLLGRKRPEPPQPDQADLLALCPHVSNADLDGQRDRPHADEDDVGVLGHVLLEPRVLGTTAEDLAEVRVGLLDDGIGALHG